MTAGVLSVEVDRRRISMDPAGFPRTERVAARLCQHWADSFAGHAGSPSTPAGYATALRDLLVYLDAQVAPTELRFVDDVMLDGWVDDLRGRVGRESTRARASAIRVLFDNLPRSELHQSLLDGTVLRWRPDVERGGVPLPDLSPGQWAALRKLAKRSVLATTLRIERARRVAAHGGDPRQRLGGWRSHEDVVWALQHDRFDFEAFVDANRDWPAWLGPPPPRVGIAPFQAAVDRVRSELFPTLVDMAGFWVAMAASTGLAPESVNDLEVDWFDATTGGELTVLRYRKQRRGSPTTPLVLLAKPRFSAQRLRDTYVELSAPLRRHAEGSHADRLWLFSPSRSVMSVRVPGATTRHFATWVHASGLDNPEVINALNATASWRLRRPALEAWTGPVDPRRIRKTDKARRIVRFGAAAATDHTLRVLVAHYTNSDLVRVRSALIITEVADTLVAFAAGPRPTPLNADGDDESSRAKVAALVGVDEDRLEGLLSGRHTIGSVACVDPYASPHDDPGRFCRQAGRELCLSCPNGVVLAEHVPALWAEVERLDRVAATMTGDEFRSAHGAYHELVVATLGVLDPVGVDAYRARGVIPAASAATATAPVHLRRRRARR